MRLRFSIRDLLWLTALVAVLLAWLVDHKSRIAAIWGSHEFESIYGQDFIRDTSNGKEWFRRDDEWVLVKPATTDQQR